jgi:hypothetical protein
MRYKSKLFAVERRGGYPWSEGYFNQNSQAPLPFELAHDGRPGTFFIRVSDDPAAGSRLASTHLHVDLFRATADDSVEVALNGKVLDGPRRDPDWIDPRIFSPKPQPTAGGGLYACMRSKNPPPAKLTRLSYRVRPDLFRRGRNEVRVRVAERGRYGPGDLIQVEKIEAAFDYPST